MATRHARKMTLLPLLLLLLVGRAAGGLEAGSTLVPDNIYYRQLSQDHVAVFSPGIQLAGQPVRTAAAPTAEDCAQLCTELVGGCDLFNFVSGGAGQVRCRPALPPQAAPPCTCRPCTPRVPINVVAPCRLQDGNCTLRSLGCTLAPVVATPPAGVASSALTAGRERRRCCCSAPRLALRWPCSCLQTQACSRCCVMCMQSRLSLLARAQAGSWQVRV